MQIGHVISLHALSSATVAQSGGTNATVGTLTSTDVDTGETFTYTLVAGIGDTDNASFNIDGTDLRANNAEALSAGTYDIRLNVNDGHTGGDFEKEFTITVTDDVNPTASSYSPTLNATGVAISSDLVLTFNENIVKENGNITIKRYSDNAVLQTIDITTGAVAISGTGATITHSTEFVSNTQYYVTIDATAFDDSAGNSYTGITSEDTWKFTTVANQPLVTTSNVTDIQANSAISGGNVTDNGGETVTERGVCWTDSTSAESCQPYTGVVVGLFTVEITGLAYGTDYLTRAYASNSQGTGYGVDVPFTTLAVASTIITTVPFDIARNSASSGGTISDDGGSPVTERGICYGESADPDDNNGTCLQDTAAGPGTFVIKITGLKENSHYHVRAYSINGIGTVYGQDENFDTYYFPWPMFLPAITNMGQEQ